MGRWINNFHVVTESKKQVRQELQTLLTAPAYVAVTQQTWVSVYPHHSLDPFQLAQQLSARLKTATLTFWLHDGDFLYYCLYERGTLRDEFNSCPNYFVGEPGEDGEDIKEVPAAEQARLQGNPQALLPYCVKGTSVNDIVSVLRTVPDVLLHDESLSPLARLLGIEEAYAEASFRDIEAGDADGLEDAQLVMPGVGNGDSDDTA